MEKQAFIRGMGIFNEYELPVQTLVTDRHVQLSKWIRENLPNVNHRFDVWHVAKSKPPLHDDIHIGMPIVLSVCVLYVVHIIGFRKKVEKLAKVKGCEEVGEWIKSMVNHLYWSAMSTESDDSQMLLEKWQSLANHIHNKHRGHGKKYKKCAHGRLGRRKWLKYSKSNIGLQSCFLIMSFL